MKIESLFLFLSLVFSASVLAQNQNSRLENRINMLENRVNRLEDRIDSLQNQNPNSPLTVNSCKSEDYVKLIERFSVTPLVENLCPYQCVNLMSNYQRNNPNKSYSCVKQR